MHLIQEGPAPHRIDLCCPLLIISAAAQRSDSMIDSQSKSSGFENFRRLLCRVLRKGTLQLNQNFEEPDNQIIVICHFYVSTSFRVRMARCHGPPLTTNFKT